MSASPIEVAPSVWRISNQVFRSNTYICGLDAPGTCILVDPGTDPALIAEAVDSLGLRPSAVVLTHGHFDHGGSAFDFQDRFAIPVFMHPLDRKTITAHVLRHTTAMRLLHAGVDTSVIALWLGHVSVDTTQIYLHADLHLKEQALARTRPSATGTGRYQPSDSLLSWLEKL